MQIKTKLIAVALTLLFVCSIGAIAVSAQSTAGASVSAPQTGSYDFTTLTITATTTQKPKINVATQVYGQLTVGSSAPPAPGYTIKVYKYKEGGPTTLVGTYKTNSAGYYYAYVTLPSTGEWYVWADFAGFGGLYQSSSGPILMHAWSGTQPTVTPSNVVLWASAQRVHLKSQLTLSGYAQTARTHFPAGRTIILYYYYKNSWAPFDFKYAGQIQTKTDANGHWQISRTVTLYGYYKFVAAYSGGYGYAYSLSNELIVLSAVG